MENKYPIGIQARKTTRAEYEKKKRKTKERLFTLYLFPILCVIAITITVAYVYNLKSKIHTYELSVADLENTVKDYQTMNNNLDASLEKSADIITELSQQIQELQKNNKALEGKINSIQEQINSTSISPTAKVDKYTDLKFNTAMTTDQMNYIIDQWNIREGGNVRFKGHGQAFITAGKLTGLNPVYLLAHSCQESGFGTTRIAREKNNFMGIGAYDNSPYESSYEMGDDIDQGIINGAMWVADNYYAQGQTNLYEMIYGDKMYSSSKDSWINSIVWLWNKSYEYL